MKRHITFVVIYLVVSVFGITPSWGAEKVTVTGEVRALSTQKAPIEGAKVQIYELNSGKSKRGNLEVKKTTLSDGLGKYKFELSASELRFGEIDKLALTFSANGYHDSYLSIGPLRDVRGSFHSEHVLYLLPKQSEISDVRIASLRLSKGRTIFQEMSSPPTRFAVPRELRKIKHAFGTANYDPRSLLVKQAAKQVEPVIRYIVMAASVRPLDPRIGVIVRDPTGYRLMRMIVPGGKSFTTNLETITDQDRWLRAETFRVVGSILDDAKGLPLSPAMRLAIEKYGPLFRGFFEPVFSLDVENMGSDRYVIDKIMTEIVDVVVYTGPDEKARVPMKPYDIFVEPKVGVSEIELDDEPLRIYEAGDPAGRDLVRFQVRINPMTPYLHYYKMRFVLLTSDHKFLTTNYFEIDM